MPGEEPEVKQGVRKDKTHQGPEIVGTNLARRASWRIGESTNRLGHRHSIRSSGIGLLGVMDSN